MEELNIDCTVYETNLTEKYKKRKKYVPLNEKNITSLISGRILEVSVKVGSKVKKGERLLVLESMKMQNSIVSPVTGIVKLVEVKEGENVPKNQLLIVLD